MAQRNFSISALQAKFQSKTNNNNGLNNNYYQFWSMEAGEEAIVRFLPDKNLDNPWFLQERVYHEFNINGEKKRVPCLNQYDGKPCPICAESVKRYKEEGDSTIVGKQLYRKKNWVGQVLVMDDPLPLDKDSGENSKDKIKLVSITSQIYNAIKVVVESGELEVAPHAYDDGTNFAIRVTQNGKYKDYSKSNFVRKSSSLPEDKIDWIEENLIDLATLMPQEPELNYVQGLLNTFLNGGVLEETKEEVAVSYKQPTKETTITEIMQEPAKATSNEETSDDDEAERFLADIRRKREAAKG